MSGTRVHAVPDPRGGNNKVVRFGSKGLAQWQRSYGPTKLELLGMITAVLDCAPYIRGRHCVVECDHQALKPLFLIQLKGAIYERWLAILQQFDIEIKYKPASEMCVTDALSRNPIFPSRLDSSPEEEDPYVPFVEEKVQPVKLPNGKNLESLFDNPVELNFIKTINVEYDADTEDDWQKHHAPLRKRGRPIKALPSQNSKVIIEDEKSPAIINDSDPFDKTTEINSDQSDYQRNTVIDSGESDPPEEALTTERASIPTLPHQTSLVTADVIQKQHSDPDLADFIKYRKNGTLSDSQKSARDILLQHSDYALINGMLFHSRIAKSKRAKTQTAYQLVVSQDMIIDILHRDHDSQFAAHGGIQNTLDNIEEHYFFPKMSQIISNYVKSCQYCQKTTKFPCINQVQHYIISNTSRAV